MPEDLKQLDSHFAFGENWRAFSDKIETSRIEAALAGLQQLLPPEEIEGRSFLDIGSGSGLSALAAKISGAGSLLAVDIDPISVETTRTVLMDGWPDGGWNCRQASVFELDPAELGRFDIVYSWGVLHHTGDMWRAIERASSLVAPGGKLAIALYRKTAMCGFWRREKRIYSRAPAWLRKLVQWGYKGLFMLAKFLRGRNAFADIRDYGKNRGMNFHNDVHDWLGGYPYESPPQIPPSTRPKPLASSNSTRSHD